MLLVHPLGSVLRRPSSLEEYSCCCSTLWVAIRDTWGTLAMGGHPQKRDTVVWGWGSPEGGTRLHLAKSLFNAQESDCDYQLKKDIPVIID